MEFAFNRHEPVYDRILFVLTLDRQKMKERILIGEEAQVRFRLQGDMDADFLCDVIRPLGTFLSEFEHDPDGEWNCLGLSPLREAPALEPLETACVGTGSRRISFKKISHRRSGENVCGVPYLERVSASQGTTGQASRL